MASQEQISKWAKTIAQHSLDLNVQDVIGNNPHPYPSEKLRLYWLLEREPISEGFEMSEGFLLHKDKDFSDWVDSSREDDESYYYSGFFREVRIEYRDLAEDLREELREELF